MRIKTGIIGWLCAIVGTVMITGAVLSFVVIEQFHDATLDRAVQTNANFIMTQAEANLSPDDFTPGNYDQKEKTFSEFFNGVDTAEIIRIKVWSPDTTVIYSDDKDILGQSFPDNEGLVESMEGRVVAEIEEPEKAENVDEQGEGELMEIYVPIKSESGSLMGVIETYTSLELVNNSINNITSLIFGIIISSSFFVAIVVAIVFINLRKKAIAPILEIQDASKKIAGGDFAIDLKTNGYDEIKNLAHDVDFMAKELSKQRDALVKAERLSAIGDLSARLAHDLLNPLNVIKNTLKIVNSESSIAANRNWQESFPRISRSIDRMTHQIDDVMVFVRTKPLKLGNYMLSAILLNSIGKLDIPSSIKINLPKTDSQITCDAEQMETVISNLLLNSMQAMKNNGTIEIRVSVADQKITIDVEDSGPGVPQDKINKLFEPLFTTKQIGTGLGLTSCKSIVNKHGGTISFKNNPTTFTIALPQNPQINVASDVDLDVPMLS